MVPTEAIGFAVGESTPFRTPRRRGRPLEMPKDDVLAHIRAWQASGELFRVHRHHPAFYARARRQFGSWANALRLAGVDHAHALAEARRRSIETRRRTHAAKLR